MKKYMSRYVVLVDISGSMRCKIAKLKDFLKDYWLPWLMGSPPVNEVALISFSNDVCVESHYTTNLGDLQTLVDGFVTSGCDGPMTSLYDAIIAGLVFEEPKPYELFVWSDMGDTISDASATDWQNLANSLSIPVNLCPPYDWLEDPNCPLMAVLVTPPIKIIPFAKSLSIAKEITSKVERVKVFESPEKFLELKPAKRKK
jgi:hypothetical protein